MHVLHRGFPNDSFGIEPSGTKPSLCHVYQLSIARSAVYEMSKTINASILVDVISLYICSAATWRKFITARTRTLVGHGCTRAGLASSRGPQTRCFSADREACILTSPLIALDGTLTSAFVEAKAPELVSVCAQELLHPTPIQSDVREATPRERPPRLVSNGRVGSYRAPAIHSTQGYAG